VDIERGTKQDVTCCTHPTFDVASSPRCVPQVGLLVIGPREKW
jgi:hypothetical protein